MTSCARRARRRSSAPAPSSATRRRTLIESRSPRHQETAQEVLLRLLDHLRHKPDEARAHRIGITGVPGVGKSTFIEAFGCQLTRLGHKVAVLAVDPSSSLTGGSILGDKTRMQDCRSTPTPSSAPRPRRAPSAASPGRRGRR
jgi:LAO/AO transport system kinase